MGTYALWQGTRSGVRVVVAATGETAVASGRLLDNMSREAAEEAMQLLERRDVLREERIAGAIARNDIVEILDASHDGDPTTNDKRRP
jgi:hypothetical protein